LNKGIEIVWGEVRRTLS